MSGSSMNMLQTAIANRLNRIVMGPNASIKAVVIEDFTDLTDLQQRVIGRGYPTPFAVLSVAGDATFADTAQEAGGINTPPQGAVALISRTTTHRLVVLNPSQADTEGRFSSLYQADDEIVETLFSEFFQADEAPAPYTFDPISLQSSGVVNTPDWAAMIYRFTVKIRRAPIART